MNQWLAVAAGGAIGSLVRLAISRWLNPSSTAAAESAQSHWASIPFGTLAVNLIGCFLIGLGAGLFPQHSLWRIFLLAGCLGGLTTFSAFGIESAQLARSGAWVIAATYVAASIGLGIGLTWVGLTITSAKPPV